MDFTYTEFPCSVDIDTFKAYLSLDKVKLPNVYGLRRQTDDDGDGADTETADAPEKRPTPMEMKSLRHLALDAIIENWSDCPVFEEISSKADRNYMLSNLDDSRPLKTLSSHIRDDFFWRKCYWQRWSTLPPRLPHRNDKAWINIYMERHLQEFIENLDTSEYDQERVQEMLDICATFINQLEINSLQPGSGGGVVDGDGGGMSDINDHIPLDYILSNLPELHTLRLAYRTKTIGKNFFLGCNMPSQRDALLLARGLSRCHNLLDFSFNSTKLLPYQLGLLARNLDKGCHNLTTLSLAHCSIGDNGIQQFLDACTRESFVTLQTLDLTNNKITSDGAYRLSRTIKSLTELKRLILRLNPIQSDGAAAIFATLDAIAIEFLDISCCSLCPQITKLFMQLIVKNSTLRSLDISNNDLGVEFGRNICKVIGFNKTLHAMDMRITKISTDDCVKIRDVLAENSKKH